MLYLFIGWSALLAGLVSILLAFVQYFVASRLAAVQKRCAVSFFFSSLSLVIFTRNSGYCCSTS